MTHGPARKPYFLLEQPVRVDDDLLNRLLGLAVVDPYKPLQLAYRPREPLRPRDAIDFLYPRHHVDCKDFKLIQGTSKTTKSSAKLQKLVKLSLASSGSQDANLEAAWFRRITMDNSLSNIDDLLREPTREDRMPSQGPEADEAISKQLKIRARYRKEVLDLLQGRPDGKLFIITSVVTCTNLAKNWDRSKSTSAQAEVTTGPAGHSSGVEVGVGAEYSRTNDIGTQGAYVGEYLIACSYLPLHASEPTGWKVPYTDYMFVQRGRPYKGHVLGQREMWRLGDKEEEGNMEAMLGAGGGNRAEASGDDDAFAFTFIYDDGDSEGDDGMTDSEEENQDEVGGW
ncbi:hypothetical protein ACJ41O_006212 [Fusarium nematophilum]